MAFNIFQTDPGWHIGCSLKVCNVASKWQLAQRVGGSMAENPGLIGVSEAARTLGVSESTVRRLADRGEIEGFRVSGTRVISVASVNALRVAREEAMLASVDGDPPEVGADDGLAMGL